MVEVVLGLYALPVKQATLSKLDGMRQERDAAVCARMPWLLARQRAQ